jgi:hypothetical protein
MFPECPAVLKLVSSDQAGLVFAMPVRTGIWSATQAPTSVPSLPKPVDVNQAPCLTMRRPGVGGVRVVKYAHRRCLYESSKHPLLTCACASPNSRPRLDPHISDSCAPGGAHPERMKMAGSRWHYGHDVRQAVPHGKPSVMAPEQAFSSEVRSGARPFSIQRG